MAAGRGTRRRCPNWARSCVPEGAGSHIRPEYWRNSRRMTDKTLGLPEARSWITIRPDDPDEQNPWVDRTERPPPQSRPRPFLSGKKGSRVVATVEQLAALVRGRLMGDGRVPLHSARPVGEAGPGDITFIENERYAKMLRTSPASAAIVGPHFKPTAAQQTLPVIEVEDPIMAFLAVRRHLGDAEKPKWTGVHPQAWVAPTARIGANVAIYPFVYVGDEAEIGDGATLHPGVVIGDRCRVGTETV